MTNTLAKANQDVREAALKNEIPLWMIAEGLNIADSTFSRWLRRELSQQKKEQVFSIIESLKAG